MRATMSLPMPGGPTVRAHAGGATWNGIGAGEDQSLERPFGHADPGFLFAWAGATASWPMRTDPGGSRGLDDCFTRDYSATSAPRSWAATSSARSAAPGTTTNGVAGGATSLRSAPRYSC